MPAISCSTIPFLALFSHIFSAMFLLCKLHEYKRQQAQKAESVRKKETEKELTNLNHKIDKLLVTLDEETEPELATSPDEECVICVSAKSTMQTFPCGHRCVCRKCFVKLIQNAVKQRLLPLRCVICRSKILRLKQTNHGGLNTGHVMRNSRYYSNTNPFYISPITSPVSPVTEVFREQRAVFVKHYDQFGYVPGQSPVTSPITPAEALSKSGMLPRGSSCVLHKHCRDKSKSISPNREPSPSSSRRSSHSSTDIGCKPNSSSEATSSEMSSFQWQFNRKRKYRRGLNRRHGSNRGRPNSLLLPIDEKDELIELLPASSKPGEMTAARGESSLSKQEPKLTQPENDVTAKHSSSPTSSTSRFSTTLLKAREWMRLRTIY